MSFSNMTPMRRMFSGVQVKSTMFNSALFFITYVYLTYLRSMTGLTNWHVDYTACSVILYCCVLCLDVCCVTTIEILDLKAIKTAPVYYNIVYCYSLELKPKFTGSNIGWLELTRINVTIIPNIIDPQSQYQWCIRFSFFLPILILTTQKYIGIRQKIMFP